ncbi:hypothetical protein [Polaromonas sp.]|uniref:hypothetical protein n=1 Tax=Polaromonas sp. TaxID=1869339 RepID=UPI00272F53F3|nr:hypothetical protein [Polaromonas sp.]MDP1742024.1 hypothetical protein [Polaromonas sp.]
MKFVTTLSITVNDHKRGPPHLGRVCAQSISPVCRVVGGGRPQPVAVAADVGKAS